MYPLQAPDHNAICIALSWVNETSTVEDLDFGNSTTPFSKTKTTLTLFQKRIPTLYYIANKYLIIVSHGSFFKAWRLKYNYIVYEVQSKSVQRPCK